MIKVIYHKDCADGFTAAWAASLAPAFDYPPDPVSDVDLGQRPVVYIACQYGDPLPDVSAEDEVYILDFSFPREVLVDLHQRVRKLVVLDHHQTAEAALAGLDFCTFDMGRSGAMMAWNFFNPYRDPPELIHYVQDRDLWRWELPDSREYSAGLRMIEPTFENWTAIYGEKPGFTKRDLVEMGRVALKVQDGLVAAMVKKAMRLRMADLPLPVLAVNSGVLISEVGHALAQASEATEGVMSGLGLVFFFVDEGMICSLRSTETGPDVSEIAKAYGGGGHARAAGFKPSYGINMSFGAGEDQ